MRNRVLYWKLLILMFLVTCLWAFSKPQPASAAVTNCETCEENYYLAYTQCQQSQYGSGCSTFECCMNAARTARDFCLGTCTLQGGSGGGGGGGGQGRNACELTCINQRADCHAHPEYNGIEDCLAEGETVIFCCHQLYHECIDGC